MRRRWDWVRDRPWLIALVVFMLVVIPGFVRVEQLNRRTDQLVACISDWADRTANRSVALTQANLDRSDALDALIRTVTTRDAALFQEKLTDYITASDHFKAVSKQNPAPPSPKLLC